MLKGLLKNIRDIKTLRKIARFIHIKNGLQKIYFKMMVPSNRVLRLEIAGIDALFNVDNYRDLVGLQESLNNHYSWNERIFLTKLSSEMKEGDVFYDIGGYIGLYTVLIGKIVGEKGKVVAFEPNANSYQKILDNIKLNSLGNIYSINKALGMALPRLSRHMEQQTID